MKKALSLFLFAILAVNSYVDSAQQAAYNWWNNYQLAK